MTTNLICNKAQVWWWPIFAIQGHVKSGNNRLARDIYFSLKAFWIHIFTSGQRCGKCLKATTLATMALLNFLNPCIKTNLRHSRDEECEIPSLFKETYGQWQNIIGSACDEQWKHPAVLWPIWDAVSLQSTSDRQKRNSAFRWWDEFRMTLNYTTATYLTTTGLSQNVACLQLKILYTATTAQQK